MQTKQVSSHLELEAYFPYAIAAASKLVLPICLLSKRADVFCPRFVHVVSRS